MRSLPQTTSRRPVLPPGVAMTGAAVTYTSLYLAAGVLTPLLVVYREEWGYAASALTLAFAVYAAGFLTALLTVGSLSDHVGRRPVLIGALTVQLASNVIFLLADGIGWVIAGRIAQGVATGAATGALTAAIVELAPASRKRLATGLGSVCVTGGLALGSLLAGVAIELTHSASSIAFVVLSVITGLGLAGIVFSAETVARTPGALRALVPRVAIPPATRPELAAAGPVVAAVWMLAGLSGGLAPSMVGSVFHHDNDLLNGVAGFIAPATSAVIGLAFAGVAPRRAMGVGIYASIVGALGIVAGVHAEVMVLMFAGQAVAGAGFGASFTASLRLVFPLAEEHQRAGVVSVIYIVSYVALGVPVAVAGYLTSSLGTVSTVTGYTALALLLSFASLLGQLRIKHLQPRPAV